MPLIGTKFVQVNSRLKTKYTLKSNKNNIRML